MKHTCEVYGDCTEDSVGVCDVCDKHFCIDHGHHYHDVPAYGDVSQCEACIEHAIQEYGR
jgi:hypothetical protein